MGRVVHKYGGSSVADADCIKRVAQRIVATKKAGNDVVVVISAMGDTTDELMDLAQQVSPLPPPRELDMLLTSGERISAALLAMAIANLGYEARSLHRLAGRRDHHVRARQRAHHRHHAGPDRGGAGRGPHRDRGRFPGRRPGHQGHHHDGPRRAPTPPRSRWPPRWRPTTARSTPTWTASSPRTRGSCRPRGRSRRSPTRRCSRWPPAAPRCCTCAASSTRGATTSPSMCAPPSRRRKAPGSSMRRNWIRWNRRSSPASPTTAARPRSPWSACPTSRVRRPGSSRRSPAPRSTST